MFDFTKEIILEKKWGLRYVKARALVWGIFVAGMFAFAYTILLPSLSFDYFFKLNDDALKNTIISPRSVDLSLIKNGTVLPDGKMFFDTSLVGNFSKADISIDLAKNSSSIEKASTAVQKSYREFFYPTGAPMGFKDGALLSADGDNYIVSNGTLRKFASVEIMQKLGFSPNAFTAVSKEELAYNQQSADITTETYPDGTFFLIDDDYYQINKGQISKFISPRAYLAQYAASQAIAKDKTFLQNYELTQTYLGFPDGTLASSSTSIFILSEGKSYPIDTPATFEAMGFVWSDVIALTSDELGMYAKQKLSFQNHPHPDGTIFADKQTGTYYIISNQSKRPIIGIDLIKSYLKKNPILIDTKSLSVKEACTLTKNLFSLRTYACTISLDKLKNLPGNDYKFEINFPKPPTLEKMNATFSTSPNLSNIKKSLSNIKSLLMANYTLTN